MKVDISGKIAHLVGNWTRTEMTDSNLDSLAVSLQQLGTAGLQKVRIDCDQLNEVDASGLQLLYIWLRSFKFRGVELEMVHPPRKLRKTLQGLLLKICYPEKSLDMAGRNVATANQWIRRSANDNHRDQRHRQAT